MKILQVITSLATGGAEKLIVDSVPLYQKEGLDVDVLLLNGNDTPLLFKLMEETNCDVYFLSKGSVYNPINILRILPYLKKYDIVHVHLFPALYWVGFAKIFSFSKTKLFFTEHSTSNKRRNKAIFTLTDRLIYSQYEKIVSVSKEVDINLKKHLRLKNLKYYLINNGVNLDVIQKAVPTKNESFFENAALNDKIIIQVASFRWPKDQATLLRALVYLPENIKLLLVGDGPLRKECETLAKELDILHRVRFLGIRMDVPGLLKIANIIVLSSIHEGLSLSSIEGLASGKPFIASAVPGLADLVNGSGLLFPPGDYQALAQHVLDLLKDDKYYDEIVESCQKKAMEYDILNMINKYIELYKCVV